jgi:hypothetical protein
VIEGTDNDIDGADCWCCWDIDDEDFCSSLTVKMGEDDFWLAFESSRVASSIMFPIVCIDPLLRSSVNTNNKNNKERERKVRRLQSHNYCHSQRKQQYMYKYKYK